MKVVTWFFMLASNITIAVLESKNTWNVISSSLQICTFILFLFLLFVEWKEKWLGKIFISLFLGENLLLNGLKEENTLFNLLFAFTMGLLSSSHYLGISFLSDSWCVLLTFVCLDSSKDLMMWFGDSICVLSWNLLLSFYKWKWIGMRPVITSITGDNEV